MKGNSRYSYIILIIICIGIGLLSRHSALFTPFLAAHLGDALWASMIYFCCRLLLPRQSLLISTAIAAFFCIAIECSQLYQREWINGIRNTLIGGLILGKGFLWMDLLRYSIGIILALCIDTYRIHTIYPREND
jgi:hypothetical protein